MPDNNINETDTKRFTVGPIIGAVMLFVILLGTVVGTGWYVKSNTKGDIAVSEISVRKDDNANAAENIIEHEKNVKATKDELSKKKFEGNWATKSIGELRDGVQQPEINQ